MADIQWQNELKIKPRVYVCGYCSATVGPDKGGFTVSHPHRQCFYYFCSNCAQPTYFDGGDRQFPGVKFGNPVQHLTKDLEQL